MSIFNKTVFVQTSVFAVITISNAIIIRKRLKHAKKYRTRCTYIKSKISTRDAVYDTKDRKDKWKWIDEGRIWRREILAWNNKCMYAIRRKENQEKHTKCAES